MKNILAKGLLGAVLLGIAATMAAERPLWLRNTRISPDGSTIAFTYKGDIFTVPSAGGRATQLTSHPAYETTPIWSPDGSKIAFSSARLGGADIYVVDATGGTPRRVTTHSGMETPLAFLGNDTILFSANIMPSATTATGGYKPQTYVVPTTGGRPQLFLSMPMLYAAASPDGKRILFRDRKGIEDVWRKHERSSGTGDVWLYEDGNFKKLTDFNGHDIDPAWGPDGTFFYVSEEENNCLNVYRRALEGGKAERLTGYSHHPVRHLSASADGSLLAYSQSGEIWTLRPGEQPRKIDVEIVMDDYDQDLVKQYLTSGLGSFDPAPDGQEVAITVRGDVYVTDSKYKTTSRVTDTDGQERELSFSPDGKRLFYDSERDGLWGIYMSEATDTSTRMAYAPQFRETVIYLDKEGRRPAQQPRVSPDGKKVAFLRDRTEIVVANSDGSNPVSVLDGSLNYSYSDGDIDFAWSPDSEWLLATYMGELGWPITDVALVKADGSKTVDLTESGYTDYYGKWALDGKAVTYMSGRYGYKSHGSWGEQMDVQLMVLDDEAWDNFNLTEEELDKAPKKKEESAAKEEKGKKKKDKKKAETPAKKTELELEGRRDRMARLTDTSGHIADFWLDPEGKKLYYCVQGADGQNSLMQRDLKKRETSVLLNGTFTNLKADKEGKNLFAYSSGGVVKVNLESGKQEPIEFEALYTRHPSKERAYIYEHVIDQVKNKFYDENLHGVDFTDYGNAYRRFLPYINNNQDFAILMSELLGELNASHTGAFHSGTPASLATASLGAFFDPDYEGDGLKVTETLAGGPLARKQSRLMPGDIITAIDGEKIEAGKDYYPMLDGKAGKKVRLDVTRRDGKKESVTMKPIGLDRQKELLYNRWVARNEALTDSLSGGKLAYVHIQGMDSPSYRRVYDRLMGKYRNREGVIVDTRYNGGGWLHNDVIQLLGGKHYVTYAPRGRAIGKEPWSQWAKPSIMLVNESNYSDASGTPAEYRNLGLGKVAGSPVPGTMTAVWWETTIDPTIVFGIPQVANVDMNGQVMENQQLNPDILIYNAPADELSGHDAQLEGAIKALMH